MKILFIANGVTSFRGRPGVCGGDVRWIEIAKRFVRNGNDVHVLTTASGKELSGKFGLNAVFHILGSPSEYNYWTFFLRWRSATHLPFSLEHFDNGFVYSTTGHCFDVFPAVKLKMRSRNVKWITAVHWVASLRRHGFFFDNLLYYIQQRIGLWYVKKYADIVLAVSPSTAQSLKEMNFENSKIYPVECGVNYDEIRHIVSDVKTKKFDACFMKRFHPAKGIFDLIEIWTKVVRKRRDAKLLLIGDAPSQLLDRLNKIIKKKNLERNVTFVSTVYDIEEKFTLTALSRLFVLPSYEENWGIVIGEAMAAGVPVICYDSKEIRSIWDDKLVWVPRGDKDRFAQEIVRLLENGVEREELSRKACRFVRKYTWNKIANEELRILQ